MEIIQGQKKLKKGHTTGSCAAAASKAALQTILTGKEVSIIVIDTPKGIKLKLPVHRLGLDSDGELSVMEPEFSKTGLKSVSCSVVKDAGDDPDVTDKLHIVSKVTVSMDETYIPDMSYEQEAYEYAVEALGKTVKVNIIGGSGVGLVTRRGLNCDVGKCAINPVPRSMILKELKAVMENAVDDVPKQIWVEIGVENGPDTALKTFNPKLGIRGGISILGTSGIVEPMSEKALVDTIKVEIDQFVRLNLEDGQDRDTVKPMLICPGNYGQDFARNELGLDLDKGVKCSNFIGEMLDYSCYFKIPKLLIVGHGGKLIKLAAGVMNTHSASADGRQEIIASHGAIQGADRQTLMALMDAVSMEEMVELMKKFEASGGPQSEGFVERTFESIETKIREHIDHRTRKQIQVEYVIFTKADGILIQSSGARDLINQLEAP